MHKLNFAKRKWLFAVMAIASLYIVYYLFRIVILSIITGSFPDLSHTHTQALGFLFIFSLGLTLGIISVINSFPEVANAIHGRTLSQSATPFEVLLHISSNEEISILESIKKLSPKAYKFEIARQTGLSRMKVHRIITRLSDRGILEVDKDGRYSQVRLANWLL